MNWTVSLDWEEASTALPWALGRQWLMADSGLVGSVRDRRLRRIRILLEELFWRNSCSRGSRRGKCNRCSVDGFSSFRSLLRRSGSLGSYSFRSLPVPGAHEAPGGVCSGSEEFDGSEEFLSMSKYNMEESLVLLWLLRSWERLLVRVF